METPVPDFIPTDPEVKYSELTHEEKLNLTQDIKHRILHGVMTSKVDGTIPTDKDSIDSMLKVMDSMDRTTIQNRRTQIDAEGNKSARDLVDPMAEFIKRAKNKNPFVGVQGEDNKGAEPEIEEDELGEYTHAKGEGEIGVINETSEEFNERMRASQAERAKQEEAELGLIN